MRARLALALVALACGFLVAPSSAEAAPYRYAVITFHKNYSDVFRSHLTWDVYKVSGGKRTTLVHKRWRAGSGFNRHSTDACRRNNGWLPNGRYRPTLYRDYHGSLIKGRAIYLGQKACHDGTVRTALFIHTEQGAGSRQCANRPGDQPCRWEYPAWNDYRSYGCVKLSPGDMHQLYDAWRRYFRLGSTSHVHVRVR